jgi:septal ring factor EnvC (AmiA/AmiB activator)
VRELAAVSAELERLAEEGRRLEEEAQGLDPRREALAQRARREIRLLYHLTEGEALAARGGPEALLEHVGQMAHVRRALDATLRELQDATRRGATIGADRERLAQAVQAAQQRRDALEQQRRQAEALAGLRIPVTNAGLEGALQPGAGPSVTVYGGGVAAAASDAPSFADAAGRLLFPVAGRAELRRAQRQGAEGPGVEIVAPLGSPVRACYPGRVAFADRYGPYGRIVILDHGDHYYTVSANLASINVRVGEEVSTGTVLGSVGDDGRGPMLYFEVRHGSETIDPAPWLGL